MTAARMFRGYRCPAEVILWAVRWYLRFPLSYRDLERMLADRGVAVDHTTLYRWVQRFAPELEQRLRRHLRPALPRAVARRRDLPPGRGWVVLPLPGGRRRRSSLHPLKSWSLRQTRGGSPSSIRSSASPPDQDSAIRQRAYSQPTQQIRKRRVQARRPSHSMGFLARARLLLERPKTSSPVAPPPPRGQRRVHGRLISAAPPSNLGGVTPVRAAPASDVPAQRAFVHRVFGVAA